MYPPPLTGSSAAAGSDEAAPLMSFRGPPSGPRNDQDQTHGVASLGNEVASPQVIRATPDVLFREAGAPAELLRSLEMAPGHNQSGGSDLWRARGELHLPPLPLAPHPERSEGPRPPIPPCRRPCDLTRGACSERAATADRGFADEAGGSARDAREPPERRRVDVLFIGFPGPGSTPCFRFVGGQGGKVLFPLSPLAPHPRAQRGGTPPVTPLASGG